MAAVDLAKNRQKLLGAYNDVVNDRTDTDWALFGYEGNSSTLKVVETGNGGLEELVDEVNSSKVMYAYCRVQDPNTKLTKYVLIVWQGEAAPESVKFKCTNHLRDVKSFFKGAHVTVNARTEDDIDSDVIISKVAKSSGANYSFHQEINQPVEPPKPVGSVYQRTVAQKDINIKKRDAFWAKTEEEEKKRQNEEKLKQQEQQRNLEEERKQREAKEASEREQHIREKMKHVHQQKAAERRANSIDKDAEKQRWEQEQEAVAHEDKVKRMRSESLRKERAAEASLLGSNKAKSARDLFEQKARETDSSSRRAPPPQRKIRSDFLSEDSRDETPARKEPIELPTEVSSLSSATQSPPLSPKEPDSPKELEESDPDEIQQVMQKGLPQRQDSEEEEEEEQNWQEPTTEELSTKLPDEPADAFENYENIGGDRRGMCAKAIYDYQAEDDTEISFDPDDIISNIEVIDEGWWNGYAPDGKFGMFPANYVELI